MRLRRFACLALISLLVSTANVSAAFFAHYFALVNGAGVVVRSSGVQSLAKSSVGTYDITFNGSLDACAVVATVSAFTPAYATARKTAVDTTVRVSVFNSSGVKVDLPFQVIVSCAP